MCCKELRLEKPALADFGEKRFASGVANIVTVMKDGAPRVHPVTPIIGDDRLFLFMEPASPKGHDLKGGSLRPSLLDG